MPSNRKIVSSYFAALIVFGLPLNLYWNQSYDDCWTVGEWLISYAGGFVRRGLPGSLLFQLSTIFHVPVVGLVWAWSIAAYLALALILRRLCFPLVSLPFILSPVLLLAPVVGNFLIRKDVYLVLCYGVCLLVIKSYVNLKVNLVQAFFLINAIATSAILTHEQFGLWALPSLVSFLAFASLRVRFLSWTRALPLSLGFFSPCLVSTVTVLLHKGNADQASAIDLAWRAIPNLLSASGQSVGPAGAIDAIGWSIQQGWRASGVSVFHAFDGWVWIPGAWILTILICFSVFVYSPSQDETNLRKIIAFLQLVCFLPIFIIGFDFGRWIYNWMAVSTLSYGLINEFRPFVVGQSSPTWQSARLVMALQSLAYRLPVIPLSERTSLVVLLLISIPRCCWSLRTYFVVSPPYYGMFLFKRYWVALSHWGHLPQSFSYPIF